MLEPKRDPSPNRGAWIVATAIVVAALIVAGVVWYLNAQDDEQRCIELQTENFDAYVQECL